MFGVSVVRNLQGGDSGFVWPDEYGADEDFKVVHHGLVPVGGSSSMLKGEGNEEE